ncbi:MAG: serine hydrolase, partial [Rhodothermales bacterium]|nr:serine hydrolase [Rhodothermales bacterium]
EETDPVLWDGLVSGRYPRLIEDFPLVDDPGTAFHYSNLTSNWLGIIVARACGTSLKSFAQTHLFDLIGARAGDWGTDANGYNNGCADLHLTARDAGRFGLLYLNLGRFEERQVVAEDWVSESLATYSDDINSAGIRAGRAGRYLHNIRYGYHWWSAEAGDSRFSLAWGHGGQLIVLLHDLDMVIVVTSKPFYLQHDQESWMHEKANLNLVGKFIQSLERDPLSPARQSPPSDTRTTTNER